jgi:hypothetical protein
MPGFEGDSCQTQTKPHSVVECASQCLDICLKKCTTKELLCYNNCTDECNKMCMENSNTNEKSKSNRGIF